jgi:hypothetical protein
MKELTDGKSTAVGSHKFKHQQWAKRYLEGDNLVEIARAADIPPCTLLRIVLPHLTTLDKYNAQPDPLIVLNLCLTCALHGRDHLRAAAARPRERTASQAQYS